MAGTIDIEALRRFRASARWGDSMNDLTTEQYRLIYDEPIYPRNLYLDRAPLGHEDHHAQVLEPNVRRLEERGVYAPPAAG